MKQVLIINTDLGMSIGKTAAQAAHAAVGAAERCGPVTLAQWRQEGVTKIVLKGKNTQALSELWGTARMLDLPCFLVTDEGRTEVPPGSTTALGIGPADDKVIDTLTRKLPLL